MITFKRLDGYKVWKTYPFRTLLPIGTDSLFVLRKEYIHDIGYDEFPITSDLESRSADQGKFLSNHPDVEFSSGALQSDEKARSGQHAVKLTAKEEFALTTKFWDIHPGDRVMISVWRYPAGSKAGIVVDSEYRSLFYQFNHENVVAKEENGWDQIRSEIIIPAFTGKDRIAVYIWNHAKEQVWLDDIRIERTAN